MHKKDPKRRLMFLDFDGCLNSYAEGSHVTNENNTYGPSPTICRRIVSLCERTGARIVLTTNWRKFDKDGWYSFNGNKVHNPMEKIYSELGEYIEGTLPVERHIPKSVALILWMEDNDYDGNEWVVVDDDEREGYAETFDHGIRDHYIQTDPEFGITEETIAKMERLLKKPYNINRPQHTRRR